MDTPNVKPCSSLRVEDMPADAQNAEAALAVRAAVASIERQFVNGSDWRSTVGQLRLIVKILEQPSRSCRRCGGTFRLENGTAFAFFRSGMPVPRHCESCREQRRQERAKREPVGFY